jgi:hypothetical protein
MLPAILNNILIYALKFFALRPTPASSEYGGDTACEKKTGDYESTNARCNYAA